jgi:hypothetical protein
MRSVQASSCRCSAKAEGFDDVVSGLFRRRASRCSSDRAARPPRRPWRSESVPGSAEGGAGSGQRGAKFAWRRSRFGSCGGEKRGRLSDASESGSATGESGPGFEGERREEQAGRPDERPGRLCEEPGRPEAKGERTRSLRKRRLNCAAPPRFVRRAAPRTRKRPREGEARLQALVARPSARRAPLAPDPERLSSKLARLSSFGGRLQAHAARLEAHAGRLCEVAGRLRLEARAPRAGARERGARVRARRLTSFGLESEAAAWMRPPGA